MLAVTRLISCIGVVTLLACAQSTQSSPRVQPGELPASWYAGGAECKDTAPFRVHAYNSDFFILRQAACTNFKKPFIYLIFGRERALLLDTGAGSVDLATPIDTLMRNRLARTGGGQSIELIVAHSHAHGDHVANDSQFVGKPRTRVVARDTASVRWFFGVKDWPED
ncbi:MAG TPA: hypothetical protein VH762_13005, partial [Gemmatimonadaceae bacterium]